MTNFDLPIPAPDDAIEWVFDMPKPTWDQWFMAKVFLSLTRSNDQQTKQGAIIVDWPSKTYVTGYNGTPRGTEGLPTLREHSAKIRFTGSDGKLYRRGEMVPKDVVPVLRRDETERLAMIDVVSTADVKYDHATDTALILPHARHRFVQTQPDKYKYMCHCETNAILQLARPSEHAVIYVPMPSCDMCAGYVLNHPFMKVKRIVYYEERDYDNKLYAARPDVSVEKYDVEKNGEPEDLLIRAAQYLKLRRLQGQAMSKGVTLTYR